VEPSLGSAAAVPIRGAKSFNCEGLIRLKPLPTAIIIETHKALTLSEQLNNQPRQEESKSKRPTQ
jgi:hypothetical protein